MRSPEVMTARRSILRRREQAFLILNAFPYASGHLMAATARHGGGLAEATAGELAEVMALVQVGMRTLSGVIAPRASMSA